MGMFDDIRFEMDCPNCKEKIKNFQSKDGECGMHLLEFWEVSHFYASCYKCQSWIEFNLPQRPNRRLVIEDYNMEIKIRNKQFALDKEGEK